MSDFGLTWAMFDGAADLGIEANDLQRDDGLETAVLLSLFADRRAESGDVLPDEQVDRRGWWADAHPVVEGDRIGSRLWLLGRSKETADIVARAEEYIREALQWLIDDLVSDRIDVTAEIVSRGVLGIAVVIHRPKVDVATFRFDYTWAAQEARIA